MNVNYSTKIKTKFPNKTNDRPIVIIGGGIQGLVIAYKLSKHGKKTIIFEADKQPGGLLVQEKIKGIVIDRFYHHYFLSDKYFLQLIEELNLQSSLFYEDFKASYGSAGSSVKESILLALMLLTPTYKLWESIPVHKLFKIFGLNKNSGLGGLLVKKFGRDYKNITSAWLWARIHTRYNVIGAIKAKFMKKERLYFLAPSASVLINTLVKYIKANNGEIKTNSPVHNLGNILKQLKPEHIVFTTPLPITQQILQNTILHVNDFVKNADITELSTWLRRLIVPKYKVAINAIVMVKKQDSSLSKKINEPYWSHLPEKFKPFLVKVAQHVAYTDLKYKVYYLGAYVNLGKIKEAKRFLQQNMLEMLNISKKDVIEVKIAVAPYAAHVPTVSYVQNLPSIYVGQISYGLYSKNDRTGKIERNLAKLTGNFQNVNKLTTKLWSSSFGQLHPWDRGTNYAIWQALEIVKKLS